MAQPHSLPASLSDAITALIETHLASAGRAVLKSGAHAVSARYRAEAGSISGDRAMLAYLACRLPATYATLDAVLADLVPLLDRPLHSQLDLGAGPGTAAWAALRHWPSLDRITLVERDSLFIAMGKTLAQVGPPTLRHADWRASDLERALPPDLTADLVTLSYALNEIAPAKRQDLIDRAWAAAAHVLVVIEPGTPGGAERIRTARSRLIAQGAYIAAPCPHDGTCPLSTGPAWCHRAVRLPRSRLHLMVKEAEVPFEDEKFSWLVASRSPLQRPHAHVLFPPRQSKPWVEVDLCRKNGQAGPVRFPARQKDAYKAARKWRWGQSLSPESCPRSLDIDRREDGGEDRGEEP